MTPSLEALLKTNPIEAAKLMQKELLWWSKNKIKTFYPETGPLRRELYIKHCQFFDAGREYRTRGCVAANRVGKTEGIGAYEVTLHLTGEYPTWWKGFRFKQANNWWVAGDTNQTTRDILQAKLLGKIVREKGDDASKPAGLGTGMIPAGAIKATRAKAGSIPNAVETAWIKHATGGISTVTFKSYEQGREAFQGTEQDGIWLDEECDEGIYNECLIRTMPTGAFKGGITLLTFTPLSGWSDVVAKFLDPEECRKSHSFVIQMGWDDAPHLSEEAKSAMLAKLPPHQRDARTKGIPQLGSGAIYPIGETEISSAVFEIPPHWPRVYGMDVGWNRTAAIWGAWNREADIVYLYEQHYFAHSESGENARAIKARGAWIPGVIDPASRGRSQVDGTQLIEQYQNLGLELSFAVNAVDSGIYDVWERMVSGRLKVFVSLADFWKEYRVYRRDEKGKIVKKGDHLMDCFTGETTIYAEVDGCRRYFRLDEVVGRTGKVHSRSGAWSDFDGCHLIGINSSIVRLRFSNGDEVRCTPEHLFLTPKGWVPAIDLVGDDVYNGISQWVHVSHLKSKISLTRAKSFLVDVITYAVSTFRETASACIAQCGKLTPASASRMGSTYTIGTISADTTGSRISNSSQKVSISEITIEESPTRSRSRRNLQPPYGTDPLKVLSGIDSTTKTSKASFIGVRNRSAANAGSVLMDFPITQNFARTLASRLLGAHVVTTTKNVFAWFVAQISWLIVSRRREVAHDDVLVRCVERVDLQESAPVYCLTVPGTHSFCIESGLVVHNCMRYLVKSGLDVAKQKPVYKPADQQFLNGRDFGSGWLG